MSRRRQENQVQLVGDELEVADPDGYAQYVRPGVARLLRAFGLDVAYLFARGDYLYRARDLPAGRPVLDLVGGYGACLFGHNHPELVATLSAALERGVTVNTQASLRPVAAQLAARLSGLVGAATGQRYVVTFGSTGADAVEAAMKHAATERVRRLDALQERLETTGRWVRREGVSGDQVPGHPGGVCWDGLLAASLGEVKRMRLAAPSYVSLDGAFHGKTAAAATLTETADAADGFRVPGPRRLRVDARAARDIATAADDERVVITLADVDAHGHLRLSEEAVSTLAACFAEPIQGEGGVREVSDEALRALRTMANRHGAALVFDEIQTGMGRTGNFLASEPSGVVADYYLLAKSLGGGLLKVSAMLVSQERYVDDFGRYHTSTFADDDLSATVALAAVDLACRLMPSIPALADRLLSELGGLVDRWPGVFSGLRGRGLLLGLELHSAATGSVLLREFLAPDAWGYVVAGYLLERHAVRVMPTLSAPLTLRVEPSAYLDDLGISHLIAAFDDMAARISDGDYAGLLNHLSRPTVGSSRQPRHAPRVRRPCADVRAAEVPRVAFLANLEGPETMRLLAPELASWTDAQCAAALDRVLGELRPFEVTRQTVHSPAAGPIEVCVIGVPFSAEQASRLLHVGERPWLSAMVLEAVGVAAGLNASVVGLGAYTSIVTGSARDIVEDRLRVTSGNSLAAACAWRAVQSFAATQPGPVRVGVVGALGNIGAVLAQLLANTAGALVLVGRAGSGRRLRRLGDALDGAAVIEVSEDMDALSNCDVVVTASNSPHPVVLPVHLGGGEPRLVYDLAVPGDVHPAVAGLAQVQWYAGGRMLLPAGQRIEFEGFGLAPGMTYACMAETMLLGFEPDAGIISRGALTPDGVRCMAELATRHGFDFAGSRRSGNLA